MAAYDVGEASSFFFALAVLGQFNRTEGKETFKEVDAQLMTVWEINSSSPD